MADGAAWVATAFFIVGSHRCEFESASALRRGARLAGDERRRIVRCGGHTGRWLAPFCWPRRETRMTPSIAAIECIRLLSWAALVTLSSNKESARPSLPAVLTSAVEMFTPAAAIALDMAASNPG